MRLKEKIKTEKREHIINTARKLFASKGFESVSINEIAKEAGIAKGTIYLYFENKYELFIEVLRFAEEMTMKKVYKFLEEKKNISTFDKIEYILNIFNEFISTYPEYISIFMILHHQLPLEVIEKIKSMIKDMQCKKIHVWDVIAEIIREGIEKGEIMQGIDPLKESIRIWFLHITRVIAFSITDSKLFASIGLKNIKQDIGATIADLINKEIKKLGGNR
ncbi:MAG TPA: TetR/AcrR family transcriptional regulator [Spirochaetota bacterium]|nr:TetR/AcrR family transcriptional regulator [Spirochaetota bacterium]HOM37649.1 TetR/AcrR family transcriptional regulator [Spirochaetota bacterium]HPQ49607.1 TetR/AcrR family transcriptional regulator [Spirochaetota bacterium]